MIMRGDMDRRVTSPTWDPPPPCKQALEAIVCCAPRYKDKIWLKTNVILTEEAVSFQVISRWIQNFRRSAGLTSSAFHDWSIEQSVSVPTFLGQLQTGCQWLRTKYTRMQLSTDLPCFFPENWTDFLFQELPEEIESKIVYIYTA